ncbi:MAG: trypsin-like peptidase domain-containing protein, partial [Pseudomonadota bacterium]
MTGRLAVGTFALPFERHALAAGWGMTSGRLTRVGLAVVASLSLATVAPAGVAELGETAGGAAAPRPIAVFGADQRTPVPAHRMKLVRSIGLLRGPTSQTVCSAFCVAPNVIATAAHCLMTPNRIWRAGLQDFRFQVSAPHGETTSALGSGHHSGRLTAHIIAGPLLSGGTAPLDASRDWALARLARSVCAPAGLNIADAAAEEVVRLTQRGAVYQAAYHRDYDNWRLAHTTECTDQEPITARRRKEVAQEFSAPDALVLHQCDTGSASSGSPLLADIGGLPSVLAINVGTYVQTRLMLRGGSVVHRFKATAVANTAVA